jgi:hypothetical protein
MEKEYARWLGECVLGMAKWTDPSRPLQNCLDVTCRNDKLPISNCQHWNLKVAYARLKLAMALLIPAWLLVTLLLCIWEPLLEGRHNWQIAAVIVPQMLTAMVFVIIPMVQRLMRRWEQR